MKRRLSLELKVAVAVMATAVFGALLVLIIPFSMKEHQSTMLTWIAAGLAVALVVSAVVLRFWSRKMTLRKQQS
ncbi:hypothetical protein [Austwickia sp. TVS 96-490-7B]|uniref:hypothetical protein n=1 Tax=Austwickia sp. TVS 96-490-7B TaxID=2830843 RepID=UPI001C57BFF7|nr:hypothetical protein [Austwickia sp. TVS 96-490-7B]